jgi:hypothetical protein
VVTLEELRESLEPRHYERFGQVSTGCGRQTKCTAAYSHRNDPRLKLKYPTEYDDTLQERKEKVSHEKTKARRELSTLITKSMEESWSMDPEHESNPTSWQASCL